eukprot:286154-Rhodomonas_salina.2
MIALVLTRRRRDVGIPSRVRPSIDDSSCNPPAPSTEPDIMMEVTVGDDEEEETVDKELADGVAADSDDAAEKGGEQEPRQEQDSEQEPEQEQEQEQEQEEQGAGLNE